ncbi:MULTISPECIES: hypothetical protein [unclassified Anabaena]|nr:MULTISPECIES: hypothetical protein [unclassified Anabaena]
MKELKDGIGSKPQGDRYSSNRTWLVYIKLISNQSNHAKVYR